MILVPWRGSRRRLHRRKADAACASLTGLREWIEDAAQAPGGADAKSRIGMKRVVASLLMCWAAFCGTQSNTAPLAFGMTPAEASIALGVPLVYYSGGPGSEIYLAYGSPGIPGFYPVDSALALQFRKGQLTGWKKDWRLRRPWPF
jgi:hypothetical protein